MLGSSPPVATVPSSVLVTAQLAQNLVCNRREARGGQKSVLRLSDRSTCSVVWTGGVLWQELFVPGFKVLPGQVWIGRDLSNHLVQVRAMGSCAWSPGKRCASAVAAEGTRSVAGIGNPGLCTATQLQH